MQHRGLTAFARARAEIKDRLLNSAALRAPPKAAPQDPDDGDAAGDNGSAERPSDDLEWVEPVFVEPVFTNGPERDELRADAVADEAAGPDSAPAPEDAVAAGVASPAVSPKKTRAPSAASWPARLRWGRRSPAALDVAPAVAARSENPAAGHNTADEIAGLQGTLAAERVAAAARIAELEAALSAAHAAARDQDAALPITAAAQREAAADEIAALRLALAAEREAAADEIAALRKTLTAEREAAADEIATLRTILAAQQEAAAARTARLQEILGATIASPSASP